MIKPPRIRIELGDVIVEMLSIVVAILLALAVNNWQARLREEHSLRANVANIVREMQANRSVLARVARQHEREAAAIDREVTLLRAHGERMSFDRFTTFFGTIAPHGLGALNLEDVAWTVAESDRSLAVMPSGERIALASVYEEQRDLRTYYDRLITTIETDTDANRFPLLADEAYQFGDVVAAEDELLHAYAAVIPALERRYRLDHGVTSDLSRPGLGRPSR